MDKKNLKVSSKGTNYQTATLIRQGMPTAEALSAAQRNEQFLGIAKKAKRRQRLGM